LPPALAEPGAVDLDRDEAEHDEQHHLHQHAEPVERPHCEEHRRGGEAHPQHEGTRRQRLGGEQDHRQRRPCHHFPAHGQRPSGGELPRAAAAVRSSCLATSSFASSATPAMEPITPLASIGISTSFWFGEVASSLKASTYFCATK